jgi:hypothetical protein
MLNAKAQRVFATLRLRGFALKRFFYACNLPIRHRDGSFVGFSLALPRSHPRSVQAKIKVNQA